ncbi:two-component hybrid sensor and regulator [Calothrix sp. NIES-4071]|nr:two-component hybrid sensor and regulator [Calothrix sp. NIES-4071]BAZ61407.1 two-component hybrid sensor and regulator [Calothrix sp. NIES-4105]
MTTELTVLIIDDSDLQREAYRGCLQQDAKYNYTIIEARSGESGLESWRRFQPDVILLEFLLPDIDGLELISQLKKQITSQPFTVMPAAIMITAQGNETVAVQAMKSGIQDYLVKRETTPEILRSTLHSVVENVRLRQKLQQSEDLIERIALATPGLLYVYDFVEQRNVYVNRQIAEVLGYTIAEIDAMGTQLLRVLMHPKDLLRLPQLLQRFYTVDDEAVETEYRMRHKNGEWRWLLSKEVVFKRNPDGSPRQIVGTALDITERKRVEDSLRRSNERFQLAAHAVNCMIYDWNIETQTVERSDGITRIFGYSPTEVEPTAEWWFSLIHPDDINASRDNLQTIPAELDSYSREYRVRFKDGNYRYVQDKGKIVRDRLKITRIVGSTTDISAAKEIENALRESEAKFRRIVDSNFVGVYFGDASGRIYEANEAFLEMFGYTGADIKTGVLRWDIMTPPEYKELDAEKIQELQSTGFCTPFEKEYFHKDGTRVPILLGIAQMEGRQDGYSACFIVNLTQLKQTEAALRQSEERYKNLLELEERARSQAETANRAKDEFVAMVSHDLRSPLNAILGWAKLLQTRKFDEGVTKSALQTIERNANSQVKLLEDLLDISRILKNKIQLELAPVNLYTIVTTAIETAYPGANAKNICFVTVLDNSIPLISGDVNRLQQVMGNLLSNAIKFTPQGGHIEVYLSLIQNNQDQQKNYIQIAVKDTGIGIKPEFLPQVFERYQQDSSTLRRQGLGLGLAITSHIIELHGGTITATSPGEGQGSTFTIQLPFNNIIPPNPP